MRSILGAVAHGVILAAAYLLPSSALACLCLPDNGVADAVEKADAVFLASVVSIRNRPVLLYSSGNAGAGMFTEEAELVVEKAWKNARIGDRLVFQSRDTSCSRSFAEAPSDPTRKPTGKWIIYAYGPQPYQLTICARSHPLTNPASPNDEAALDALRK